MKSVHLVNSRNQRLPATIVIRVLQVLLIILLFWPYADGSLIGDDLTLVVSALHAQQTGESLLQYSWSLVQLSTSANHVLPLGGLLTAIVTWPLAWLGSFGLSVPLLWAGLRIAMIILTLFVVAWSAIEWIAPDAERMLKRQLLWTVFLYGSAAAGALVQVHGYWSQDPVLAYGIAAWVSPILVFGFLGGIRRVYSSRTWISPWAIGCLAIGILGIFVYELTVIGALTALALPPVLLLLRFKGLSTRGLILGMIVPLVIFIIFLSVQYLRLLNPGTYSGSNPGYAQMALPVWVTSMLGNLPLTNTLLTREFALEPDPSTLLLIGVPVLVLSLWIMGQRMHLRIQQQIQWTSVSVFLGILVVVTGLATAMYAFTVKYQLEIGNQVGKVYLFYAFGLIWVAFSTAVLTTALGVRSTIGAIANTVLGLTLAFASVTQYVINSASLSAINAEWAWTKNYVWSLQGLEVEQDWCELSTSLKDSQIPTEYRAQLQRQAAEIQAEQGREIRC